jgi:hypothetical protein
MLNLPPLPEDATYADTLREPVDAARATLRAVLADAALQTLRVLGSAAEDLRNLAPDTTADPKGNLRAAAVLELCSTGSKLLKSYNKTLSEVITPDDPALDQVRGVRPDSVLYLMRDMMGMIQASLGSTSPRAEPGLDSGGSLAPQAEPYWVDDFNAAPASDCPTLHVDPIPRVNYFGILNLERSAEDIPSDRLPPRPPPYVKIDVSLPPNQEAPLAFLPFYMTVEEFIAFVAWSFDLGGHGVWNLDPRVAGYARGSRTDANTVSSRVMQDAHAQGLSWVARQETLDLLAPRARVFLLRSLIVDFLEDIAPEVERVRAAREVQRDLEP